MNTNRKYTLAFLAALALTAAPTLSGCSIYKINVQQGNFLKDENIAKLKVGMTKRQVQFLLGSPVLSDPFHEERWDYIFFFHNGKTGVSSQRNLRVFFDGDTVERIELPEDFTPPSA